MIEKTQSGSTERARPSVLTSLAREAGRKGAEIQFGLRRASQVLFDVGNMFNPFATNFFTISDKFNRYMRPTVTNAVKMSNLPEGIHVTPDEKDNSKIPFVVITANPSPQNAINAYANGASKYVVYDARAAKLAGSLSS
ncbi:hypothetical protein A3D77_00820 [Candidatus Gottesmanbacteria bacterium RIFCSPHIGHO2_02_FULL_39_11]|uniref:Uncharacterized protein n=1 Tax=Candidatus Gottesmanbacteria bacterium RIFCSPHIGHO2_02_FULL_39_11 TaxID=1798382 RepID=A0A1F5ZNF6_9BACT|nr:MAG: hypothetical protein A3D77_00820 [Candidatus Gottesmanbacteria bacterium RIFCSPHIGHO2_02_FULL_39_11]